jgi:rhomboid protease GluP
MWRAVDEPISEQSAAPAPVEIPAGEASPLELWLARLSRHEQMRGYVAPVPEELLALGAQLDVVQIRSDLALGVSGILRCGGGTAGFTMSREQLLSLGRSCLKYTGSVNGVKMPVSFRIHLLAQGAPSAAEQEQWSALQKSLPGRDKVTIDIFHLDIDSGQVWSAGWARGLLRGRRRLEAFVRSPQPHSDLLEPVTAVMPQSKRFALATALLLGVLTLLFALEHWVKLGGKTSGLLGLDVHTLLAMGGMNGQSVSQQGQWYRLLTAAMLHADALHLLLNGLALALAGFLLESLLGRAWLVLLFFAGALGGSLMGLALNPDNIVSVGASGAVMGLLAAALIVAMRFPAGMQRSQIQGQLLRFLVPSLIPLATVQGGGHIDYAAHLGGALSGLVGGWLAWRLWPKTQEKPRGAGVVTALAVVATLTLVGSGVMVARDFSAQAELASIMTGELLVGDGVIPEDMSTAKEQVEQWGQAHPRDPRVHLFRALKLLDAKEPVGAEQELRAGLAEKVILDRVFSDGKLDTTLRALLAEQLLAQGRRDEAVQVAAPRCKSEGGATPEVLWELGVCQ